MGFYPIEAKSLPGLFEPYTLDGSKVLGGIGVNYAYE